MLNSYDYTFVENNVVFKNREKPLIYEFANEINIEYKLLDTETANLVFLIVLFTSKKFLFNFLIINF